MSEKCVISVKSYFGKHHAYMDIAQQGFCIMPIYEEGEDEEAKQSADWTARMLYKALLRVTKNVELNLGEQDEG